MKNDDAQAPVSVIIPAYNISKYITYTIDSLIGQSVKPYEIIIIDDGSTDNTSDIIIDTYKNNKLIKIFYQPNRGAGEAKNYGISLAKADYIYCCDSDDVVLPGLFEEFKKRLQDNNGLDMFCISTELFYEDGVKEVKINHARSGWVDSGKNVFIDCILRDNYTAASWSYILKRKVVVDNNLKFFGRVHEDLSFTMSAYFASNEVFRTKNIFYSQRARKGSLTRSKNNIDFVKNRIEAFNATLDILEKIGEHEDSRIKFVKAKYINRSLMSLVDMCIDFNMFLPDIVSKHIREFKYAPSTSLKEKLLLKNPALFFVLKKAYALLTQHN